MIENIIQFQRNKIILFCIIVRNNQNVHLLVEYLTH